MQGSEVNHTFGQFIPEFEQLFSVSLLLGISTPTFQQLLLSQILSSDYSGQ